MLYLIYIEAERHQGNTQAALLRSLAGLGTHVERLNCQLSARKQKVTRRHAETRVGEYTCGALAHHVRMSLAGHFFAGVQVKKLVHLGARQSVSDLQVLHNKHLARYRLFCW